MKIKNSNWFYSITIIGMILIIFGGCKKDDEKKPPETVTDIDGNVYHTITIGNQVWLLENLKVTRYRNGDLILNVTDSTQWDTLSTGAYCFYNNIEANASTYGHLYNFYTISDSRGLAPQGWHIPSDAEWSTLINYLGGEDVAGGSMKTTGTSYWKTPNTGATNSSGLNVLPGGCRKDSTYDYLGSHAIFWTSTSSSTSGAYYLSLSYGGENVYRAAFLMTYGLSIRCVMD